MSMSMELAYFFQKMPVRFYVSRKSKGFPAARGALSLSLVSARKACSGYKSRIVILPRFGIHQPETVHRVPLAYVFDRNTVYHAALRDPAINTVLIPQKRRTHHSPAFLSRKTKAEQGKCSHLHIYFTSLLSIPAEMNKHTSARQEQ